MQEYGDPELMDWGLYAQELRERIRTSIFQDSMAELVLLRQQGSMEFYHDQFVSILTQLRLPKHYAFSIFVSNLKVEIRKYLRLFRPRTLV